MSGIVNQDRKRTLKAKTKKQKKAPSADKQEEIKGLDSEIDLDESGS
jgi:hypothetical protein